MGRSELFLRKYLDKETENARLRKGGKKRTLEFGVVFMIERRGRELNVGHIPGGPCFPKKQKLIRN